MAGVPSFSTEEEEALSASLIAQLLQEDQTDPFAAARSLFVSDEGSVEDDELYSLGGERKPKKRGKRKGTAKSRGKKQVKKQRTSPSVEGIDVNETSTINVGKEEKKQDHLQKKSKRKSYPETRVTVPPDDLVKMSVEDIVAYADNIKATRLDLTEDEKKDLKRMERLVKNRESARAWRARKKEQKESNGSNAAEEIDVQQPSPKKPRQAKRSKKVVLFPCCRCGFRFLRMPSSLFIRSLKQERTLKRPKLERQREKRGYLPIFQRKFFPR